QHVVEGVADAAAHVAGPAHVVAVGPTRDDRNRHHDTDAVSVAPAEIAFEAEHGAVDLPIVAEHHTADDSVRHRIVFGGDTIVVHARAAEQIAEVSAGIEAGPVVRRRSGEYGRRLARDRQIRCESGTYCGHDDRKSNAPFDESAKV